MQVYASTAYPSVAGGDSGELVSVAFHLVIHPARWYRALSHSSQNESSPLNLSRTLAQAALCVMLRGSADSKRFQGVAHPPGYPLFTMLAAAGEPGPTLLLSGSSRYNE